jgi:tetratricopeptide (TPR) repeat protein
VGELSAYSAPYAFHSLQFCVRCLTMLPVRGVIAYVGKLMRPLLLALVLFFSSAVPVLANDEQDCFQGKDPQLRIKGCSEIVARAPNDASAYHNRAVAFGLSGDIDRAIADYTKTIEIRPDNAAAYENRGRAYASKGDYTHAVADAMKASELVAKATAQPEKIAPKPPKIGAITPKSPKTAATQNPPKTKAIPQANNDAGTQTSGDAWPSWAPK